MLFYGSWDTNQGAGFVPAFELFKKETIDQKIEHIHFNPTTQRWNLCKEPADYYYSSAGFYEKRVNNFKFLKHIGEAI